ncbi:diacylglycerol/lipid kinase family protein [Gordonia bronchialis]|uniref:diacylglycerol/lipid kinase family protein n=1 Tax=Gordonia bronchialis TaxID=2054 RepID=UPI00242B7E3B|nr:diacylglycerol kinase family protein [Gordonia bronchialis]
MAIERRLSAVLSLLAVTALTVLLVVFLFRGGLAILLGLGGLALTVAGAWWAITERTSRRTVGIIAGLAGVAIIGGALALVLTGAERLLIGLGIAVVLLACATACARFAVLPDLHALDAERVARPPSKAVLICNPRSGDGKVGKFGIIAAAAELGVRTIVLEAGDDLEQLARDAVADGADCLGMAGGDGSQALVASVAVEHDLPFVCVSAGTRNHFALDLGLDRDDPVSTLRAFADGVERRVDYATVNDRLFVNNVSLGVYATVVAQESYRADKARTAASMLPELLGRDARPFDLQFTTPAGDEVDGAFVILVSNNPYATSFSPDAATRHRLDTGRLGVIAVSSATGADAVALMTLSAIGLRRSSPFWHEFTARAFEIRSRGGRADAGIDGEAVQLDTPLVFRSHPKGLRLLVPAGNRAVAARRQARDVHVRTLVQVAAGRTPGSPCR